MFDAFNVDSANQLKRHWRTLAETPVLTENPQGLELWNEISQPPAEAIPFRGSATTADPMENSSLPKQGTHGVGLQCCSLRAFLFIARDRMESWMFWGGGLLLGYGLITSTLNWWNYFRRTQQQSWYQSGWISPQEFAICTGDAGVRMPIGEIVQKTEYPQTKYY